MSTAKHQPQSNLKPPFSKRGSKYLRATRPGSMLLELTVALTLLASIGLITLKGSVDTLAPRQWTIIQNLSDAYLTYEEAYAHRVSFEVITAPTPGVSPWPIYPATAVTNNVVLGRLPNTPGPLTGTITRTRMPDTSNGNGLTNPFEMVTWKLQSHLTYVVSGNTYVKSRTVIRTQ